MIVSLDHVRCVPSVYNNSEVVVVVTMNLMGRIICTFFVALCSIAVSNGDKTVLNIQGFVPRHNPTFVANSIEPAAHLAVEDVNNSTLYLTNYTLNLAFVDTKVVIIAYICGPN